jgi:hypothetical protein
MRTIKLCATTTRQPTTLLSAIQRSTVAIERAGRLRNPLPAAVASNVSNASDALNATTAPA